MERLVLELDWLDRDGTLGPELAATFARFQIRVGNDVLTRTIDRETNAVRDFLHVPLYPLAEWLASNWWALRYEPENPAKRARPGFHDRHRLRAGREGYSFPRVELVSSGMRTRIVSATDPMPRPNSDLVYVEQRTRWVSTHKLFETLGRLIEQVLRRLASLGVTGTGLEDEWAAIQSADDAESSFCRAAARLGSAGTRMPSTTGNATRCSCSPSGWAGSSTKRRPPWTRTTPRQVLTQSWKHSKTPSATHLPFDASGRSPGKVPAASQPPTRSPNRRGAPSPSGCARRSAHRPSRFGPGMSWPPRWTRIPGDSKRRSGHATALPRCRPSTASWREPKTDPPRSRSQSARHGDCDSASAAPWRRRWPHLDKARSSRRR